MPVLTRIVPIGNSRGLRIPKAIRSQCHLEDAVELIPRDDGLLVRPVPSTLPPRAGWEDSFRTMGRQGDDTVLDGPTCDRTEWETEDWQW